MKLMIASDIHGSAHWCRRLLEAWDREGADRLVLLGDILYHGPRNALPEEYAPMEVAAMLNERSGRIFGVRGNCDAEIDQTVLGFPLLSDYALLLWENRTLFCTHGHVYTPEAHPRLRDGDAFLFGHIHTPVCRREKGILYLNPGSAALPKENTQNSCMVLEDGVFRWLDLADGSCWQETPWEA